MNRLLTWLKSRAKTFKIFFLTAVVLLVALQLTSIARSISGEEVTAALSDLAFWRILLMIFIGLLAVSPMVLYDFLLHKMVEKEDKAFYIFETSWLVNTMNNLIGFGGVFSFGLRSQFYSEEGKEKQVFNAISKIFLFTMSGLSIYSLLCLFLIAAGHTNAFLSQYWMWLLVGALYFPAVLLTTSLKKEGLLGGLSKRLRLELLGVSFLEWTGVMLAFVLIGQLMSIHVPAYEVILLFIVAMVLGILSMIPGAIGSFDVVMILGLTHLGVAQEKTVAWLLLFRIVYYFLPFILGLLFAVKNLGVKFNDNYRGVPLDLIRQVLNHVVTFLLYVSGILMVLSATVPEVFRQLIWLRKISPWSANLVGEFPKILIGFLLIVAGRAISNRVIRAYYPTLILEIATLIYISHTGFSIYSELFMILLIVLTIFTKSELFRKQLVLSYEMLFKDGLVYFLLIILYAGIGVYNSPNIHHKHPFNNFFLFPSERIWLTGFLAILLVNIIAMLFIRYLQGHRQTIGEKVDEERVLSVLHTYGGSTESHLIFLNDKDMYMYKNKQGEDTVFLQFQTYHDKVVVMGSPSGKAEDFEPCLRQFIEECDLWGYAPVFYEVKEKETLILHELGFRFFKMGEEGHVSLPDFTISGKKQRGNRAIVNRLEREGCHMEVIEPPFSEEIIDTLREISNEWLGERKEKGFSLGFFSEEYISKAPVAVVKNEQGEISAFATIMPSYTQDVVTVDLMRFSKEAPAGVMDYLFIKLFEHYRDEGIQSFDLGMAPLSNVGVSRKSFLNERLANLIYQFGSRFYSFQGLRSYKEKYATTWKPRYNLYSRDNSILFVVYSLLMVDNRAVEISKKRKPIK
ncbi:phosphatidylglycerol lysyltransferase [Pilibacter termitis]|uniref:Phosphatidylglycerol lysyltransferase n=1 Tax=Pilibacter termitis TaxID=263852 RepID=A0A1T4L415_9ENTE|nr:bifunctional lysylphosphatidylglycerol flippase/synthetase MprF [Pilibacter termitis]SJZ49393.1 phosphatidylglycerol lysyltransferase [Pilibacter termitis]